MGYIYTIIGILTIGLGFCIYWAIKLIKNHPKIKDKLEIFPIPGKRKELSKEWKESKMLDKLKPTKEETPLVELLKPKEKQEILSVEEEEKQRAIRQRTWFEKQKIRALRQLQPFKLTNVDFVPTNSFIENEGEVYTRGYMLDASFTLEEVIKKHFQNKKKIVFYLSEDSDGIFHKTSASKHSAHKHENHITVQAWSE